MALDFTTSVLDPRVTVTRALDTATRVNSSGYIETVNANLPRFDYNPTTLAPKGLLIEEARTNLILQSSNASQLPWAPAFSGVGTLAVVTPNAGVSPDGTSNAVRVQLNCVDATSSSNRSRIQQIVTLVNGTTYAKGVWIKAYDASNVGKTVRVLIEGASGTSVYTLTDQWVRVTPAAAAATGVVGTFMVETRGTFTTQTADILMWNATLEAGAFLTSDIITSAASVTRNADVVSMTGTNFSDWYNTSEGTFVVNVNQSPASGLAIALDAASDASNRISLIKAATSGYANFFIFNSASLEANITNANVIGTGKIVGAYKANNCALSSNGVSPIVDTSVVLPTPTFLRIGARQDGGSIWCAAIKQVFYYPQRLTTAEVQAFSK
jgi:hypothetical protein